MKHYIFSILGAVIVGVGSAWLLATGVTLAYRSVTGATAMNYQSAKTATSVTPPILIPLSPAEANHGYYRLDPKAEPLVSARAYLLADLETGEVLASRKPDFVYPIASITKLMTALVSIEAINQANGELVAGEKLSPADLLYPLLLESSNDAAETIARYYGRERFIALMNKQATAIGLTQTSFADPSGIGEANRSTARDLFRFADYLYRYQRYPITLTQIPQKRYGEYLWLNNNRLIGAAGYLGGKTGRTVAARETLIALFNAELNDGSHRPVGFVLLQSDNRDIDAEALLHYLRTAIAYRP